MKILLTGGAGFIGGALTALLLRDSAHAVVNLDAMTYAASATRVAEFQRAARYTFVQGDINDRRLLAELFAREQPDAVVHLAAQTHVDRSISDPQVFVHTNVTGTGALLHAALGYWRALPPARAAAFRFLHVSTDEVFGGPPGRIDEDTPYAPRSPYSASKAGADFLVRAYQSTWGFPAIVTHASNNYGPGQYPEKLIPVCILCALRGDPIPVYGDGEHVRDWLHVDDHARALLRILERAAVPARFVIGGGNPLANIEVVRRICTLLDVLREYQPGTHAGLIRFVDDRPGHDRHYALDNSRLAHELGWGPDIDFSAGLEQTVRWYLDDAGQTPEHG